MKHLFFSWENFFSQQEQISFQEQNNEIRNQLKSNTTCILVKQMKSILLSFLIILNKEILLTVKQKYIYI